MQNKRPLLLCFLLLASMPVYAERADRDQPVNIDADQVVVDDARQTSTFTGNVVLTQGTMVIRGDKISVVQDKAGFKHGTASGHTASFRQKREGLNEYVEGYGERIEYDSRVDTIDFYVKARVKRDQDEVSGEHVTYNSNTEIFQADSQGGVAASGGRVHAVLYSKPKPGKEDAPVAGSGGRSKDAAPDNETRRPLTPPLSAGEASASSPRGQHAK